MKAAPSSTAFHVVDRPQPGRLASSYLGVVEVEVPPELGLLLLDVPDDPDEPAPLLLDPALPELPELPLLPDVPELAPLDVPAPELDAPEDDPGVELPLPEPIADGMAPPMPL